MNIANASRWIHSLAGVGALLPFGSAAAATDAPTAVPVTVARVEAQLLGAPGTATGEVASRHDASISTEIAGRLVWVAEPGTEVARGAPLARLDTSDLELTLRETEASVRRIDAEARMLAAQRDRLHSLGSNGIVSDAQLEEATARHEMAAQQLEQARVNRDRARLAMQRAQIRAPFSGAVVERLRAAGEYVTVGTPLVRVVDTRSVEVVARAPLIFAQTVRAGTAAMLEMNGSKARGKVRAVVPVGAPVKLVLAGSAEHAGISVPRDAVILRQAATYVFRVAEDGTAEKVAVEVGAGRGSAVAVVGKLRSGDRVIVRGGERLQAGQAVTVTNERTSVADARG